MEIDYINDELDLDLPTDEYETISGLIIALLGEIPEEEEHPEIDYKNYTFSVLDSNEKIIKAVKIKVNEIADLEDEKSATEIVETKTKATRESGS